MTVLDVKDIHKVYREGIHAVRGVSFKVKAGEIYGLIGPNGAGKTTTLRIIAGLIKPTKGEVYLNGFNVHRDVNRAKRHLAYLPEEAEVYPRLTGMEHIEFYAKLYGLGKNEIEYAAGLSGLGDWLYEKAGEYSKGMKRRLLLSIVLMRKPKLVLLDEPTNGLDTYASVKVRGMVKSFVAESGCAMIISSHNMLEIEYLADRVGLIYAGRIILEDHPDRIIEELKVSNLEEAFIAKIEELSHGSVPKDAEGSHP